jgi:hypothetical protein
MNYALHAVGEKTTPEVIPAPPEEKTAHQKKIPESPEEIPEPPEEFQDCQVVKKFRPVGMVKKSYSPHFDDAQLLHYLSPTNCPNILFLASTFDFHLL